MKQILLTCLYICALGFYSCESDPQIVGKTGEDEDLCTDSKREIVDKGITCMDCLFNDASIPEVTYCLTTNDDGVNVVTQFSKCIEVTVRLEDGQTFEDFIEKIEKEATCQNVQL